MCLVGYPTGVVDALYARKDRKQGCKEDSPNIIYFQVRDTAQKLIDPMRTHLIVAFADGPTRPDYRPWRWPNFWYWQCKDYMARLCSSVSDLPPVTTETTQLCHF